MAENASDASGDANEFVSRRPMENTCYPERKPHSQKAFERVQCENDITPLFAEYPKHIGGADITAAMLSYINALGARDEKSVWT